MSATIFSDARFGLKDDATVTGLLVGSFGVSYSIEEAFVKNHIGQDVGMGLFNDKSEISVSGVVKTLGTGLVPKLASVIDFANESADTLNVASKNLPSTPNANAGVIVKGGSLTRENSGFETGDLTASYSPAIPTNSPSVIT